MRDLDHRCQLCGHRWVPFPGLAVRVCPRCKSAYWDRPRRGPGGAAVREPRRPRSPLPSLSGADAIPVTVKEEVLSNG